MAKITHLKYPTYNSQKQIWICAIIIAALVYLFLAAFQPFGTYNYLHTNKYLLLMPYSLIAFFVFFTGDFFISKHCTKWTLKYEIFKITSLLFLCSILNYWYSLYFINDAEFHFQTLLYMILFTYTLGIPICSIYILGKYTFLKTTEVTPEQPKSTFEMDIKADVTLLIIPDVGKKMELSKSDFFFAQSEGNYSNIFFLKNGITEKKLLRISLKNLEKQIADDEIFRCHRSYILNTQNAIDKQGNSQGYKISLRNTQEKIPVSRKYINKVIEISV